MKTLILTGLATEHSFTKGGQEQYFLVFNDGAVRIPVPEQTAEAVIRELYANSPMLSQTSQNVYEQPQTVTEGGSPEEIVIGTVGDTYAGTDEDGIDQV